MTCEGMHMYLPRIVLVIIWGFSSLILNAAIGPPFAGFDDAHVINICIIGAALCVAFSIGVAARSKGWLGNKLAKRYDVSSVRSYDELKSYLRNMVAFDRVGTRDVYDVNGNACLMLAIARNLM